ncbi:MAG: 4-alpha-glucanotransferase [Thermodesulfovibrio sp.]|nr:4-alpha-glucanotransferase [Thermodesulfovibrio sp.]
MKNLNQLIDRVSELVGIITYYYNYIGEKIETSLETKISILSSMGIEVNEKSLTHWIEYFEDYQWENLTQPVYVIVEDSPIFIYKEAKSSNFIQIEISPFYELGTEGEAINLSIDLHQSDIIEKKTVKDRLFFKYSLSLPSLPIGYYKIKVSLEDKISESLLIIVPFHCFSPFKDKTWGFHVNVWSLRGDQKEGDLSHVKNFCQYVKRLGGFISINPLHFNNPEDIYGISPYSAISRQFKTPLYVSEGQVLEENKNFFEYSRVWREKIKRLRENFKKFLISFDINASYVKSFKEYKNNLCEAIREDLKYFAVFCFLREKFGKDWLFWEEKFQNPCEKIINSLYQDNFKEILFYEYLQWLVDREIETLKDYNICFDLGFGSIKQSFDVWMNKEVYALKAEYGAPPDDFNPKGQKWGFPPLIPFKLREKGYLPLIKMLKTNMKGKLLRIDHALGIFRAFWIPEDNLPQNGAYVKYPWQDIIGIICLESQLNKAGVIGEDLGTAEEWMREELIKRKIASWKVFYFEKNDSDFKDSSEYPEEALCSITTHDLPTFKGYWHGKDIELRRDFSIFDESMYFRSKEERVKDKEKILRLLSKCGLLKAGQNLEHLLLSLIQFLSETKSKYLLLYPEDILLIEEQVNLPGTTTEYPNWQRKLPITVDDFLNLPILEKLETILKKTGRTQWTL